MRLFSCLLAILGFLIVGCQPRSTPHGPAPTATSAELKARLDAAKAITFSTDRDQALTAVARDAAKAGDVGTTKTAIGLITFTGVKDQTAAECALKLAAAGQPAGGTEVAQLITFTNIRDDTLKKLATGAR